MSQIKLLLDVITDIRHLGDSLEAYAEALISSDRLNLDDFEQIYPPPGEELPQEEPLKSISLAEIRGALAEKSRAGHSAEVKALIARHGADKLSGIDPKEYPAMMKELGAM